MGYPTTPYPTLRSSSGLLNLSRNEMWGGRSEHWVGYPTLGGIGVNIGWVPYPTECFPSGFFKGTHVPLHR